MLPDCAQHNTRTFLSSSSASKVSRNWSRWHLDDVERRPVEDDIGAFLNDIDLHTEAVECGRRGSDEVIDIMLRFRCLVSRAGRSQFILAGDKLPAKELPTGDLGISRTNK